MKGFGPIKKVLKIVTGVKFAILILTVIAIASSLGSFIEQDEPLAFYQENYPTTKPIFGILTWNLITQLGLNHVYRTWWFFGLLIFLVISLISCTMTRQFPIFSNSKEYFFRQKKESFLNLPFSVKLKNIYYLKENILSKIQDLDFYIYQNGNLTYGYKGLIGRISPILVHFSLIIILFGSFLTAFNNFKAQEILPKGEIFHIQNPIQIGWFTSLPTVTTRVNDFWVEYENNRIHQFYSNLSLLDNFGNEIEHQTISVNNPLRYQNIDFYQSDWNLLGIRFQELTKNNIYESPFFSLEKASKSWITWISNSNTNFTLIFDQLQNTFLVYDEFGNFLNLKNVGDVINSKFLIIDILSSTGLQIKYDPSISIIYFGFGLLMITACLSYLPYTQIWIFSQNGNCWVGGSTNRGKIKLEIEFENLIRDLERSISKNIFIQKNLEN
uniref:Cytochrome c biogenesis protein CcsB n=1 Tax=Synura uvella TaxID=52557 RepID=A0A3G2QZA4_9STRA|nr:c-type cytochrome biogenensis protein [Synura uvella]YP_009545313.1 c-type cytochrome biogenensis protein [Synura uvella]AYO28446.1 c-type cytochrome biogenensis protein [Synura uvella]AYO28467.1 c-type cytochrome biogenensis protein [Synura uvella]